MDRGFDIPWVGGQHTMGRRVDIPWVGGQYTMDRMFDIHFCTMGRGSKYLG